MPPVVRRDNLLTIIRKLQTDVARLAHAVNATYSNAQAQPVINIGLIPYLYGPGPNGARYGLQVLNPGSGSVGTPVVELGQQGDGTYGLEVFDPSRNLRVQVGELNTSGDFGIRVFDSAGAGMAILPSYDATVTTQEATTSTSYTDLTTPGPEVTIQVGSSGRVQVTASAFIQVPVQTSQAGGFVGVSVDGATPSEDLVYLFNSIGVAGGYLAGSYSATTIISGLSQGSHTLKLQYRCYASATGADFANRFILAQGL